MDMSCSVSSLAQTDAGDMGPADMPCYLTSIGARKKKNGIDGPVNVHAPLEPETELARGGDGLITMY